MSVTVGDHRSLDDAEIEPDSISHILNAVYRDLELPAGDVDVSLVDDDTIAGLNRDYRGKHSPTNVLSFPHYNWIEPRLMLDSIPIPNEDSPPVLWGEVFVSIETIRRESSASGRPLIIEIVKMCIHGLLHLFGYDHDTDDQYNRMSAAEQIGLDSAVQWMEHNFS
ncbi:rRNA maturation RNase YbeY [bacterium]|nr:rRNA maturation RNase YbeY [candidate division CSSED10-310 bacterium]